MTTYYVSSEIGQANNAGTSASAPLATLQAAADLVKPGDTVLVMNGTYTGPFYGSVLNITTSGTASAPITFAAAPGQTPVIDSSGTWNGILIQASYIVVKGFTVVGDAADYTLSEALAAYSTGDVNLNGNGITVSSPGNGVVPHHITIENNTVYNEPGGGIGTLGADYVQILNNVVHDNAHWSAYGTSGISVAASENFDTNSGVHFVISGNTSFNNQQLVPSNGVGRITDGEGIILDSNSGFVGQMLVQNNTTYGNSGPGIETFFTNNVTITGNTAYNNVNDPGLKASGQTEILVNQSQNNTVTNNVTTAPNTPPPAAPVITSDTVDFGGVITLKGTAQAFNTITVFDNSTKLGTVIADANGAWTFATPPLANGLQSFTATATDSVGHSSALSSPLAVTLDVPVNLVTNGGFETGSLSGWTLGGKYSASEVFVAGQGASGSANAVSMGSIGSDGTLSQTIATTPGQTYTLSFWLLNDASGGNDFAAIWNGQKLLSLVDAAKFGYTQYTYTVTATGSTSTLQFSVKNDPGAFLIDNIALAAGDTSGSAPMAPTIASFSTDSGITGDHITNDNSLTLTGTAQANSTVKVYEGTTLLGSVVANGSGAWTYTTAALGNGAHSLTATATDAAGHVSAASATTSVTIDTLVPNAPVETAASIVSGTTKVQLTGTAEANSSVQVFDGANPVGTVTADGSGAWSLTTGNLASGSHSFTAKATDAAGNTSVGSAAKAVTIPSAPGAPSAPTIANISNDSGVAGDNVTNDNTLTLTGTAVANSTVDVFDGATKIGTTTADANGSWSYITSVLNDAIHVLKATDTVSGVTSAASSPLTVTVDTVAPTPVLSSNSIVNGNQVKLSGTAEANSTVTVYDGTTVVGTGTTNSTGAWSITTNALSTGTHALTAKAADVAGNVSAASQSINSEITGTPTSTQIESAGSTSLVQVGANFYLNSTGGGTGPLLKQGGTAFSAGQAGSWLPIGVEKTATGYQIAWKNTAADQYSVWNTDSDGNYISNEIGVVSGTSTTLKSFETSLHQDLNGDGVIGNPVSVIESDGSTSLVRVGDNFYLNSASGGTGPLLKQGGTAFSAGQAGSWLPIGVEKTATGYQIAWKNMAADEYSVWNTDSNGNYLHNAIGVVTGASTTLKSFETSFGQDLNGDGLVGVSSASAPSSSIDLTTMSKDGSDIVTIKGVAAANSQIKLYEGNTSLGTATTAADGTWSFKTSSAVSDTVHTYTAKQIDSSGHVVGTSGSAILGSTGSNTLNGTSGNDLFVGGDQSDTFVFAANFGRDVIKDFTASGSAHDTIQFGKTVFDSFASVLSHASQVGQDVVISAGTDTLTLKNTKVGSLNSYDFHFS